MSLGEEATAASTTAEVRTAVHAHALPPGWPGGVPLTAAESMAACAREEATAASATAEVRTSAHALPPGWPGGVPGEEATK
jgi:hypothetical protein